MTVAIDVGGTFTDAVALDENSGRLSRTKSQTTPGNIANGQVAALKNLDLGNAEIVRIVNGTTVVTNALLTRSGARTALVTTLGFEDSLESGRERRVGGGLSMHDLRQAGPKALVPRFLRYAVDERIAADGTVLRQLDEAGIDNIAESLASRQIEAVAIVFLFSYVNPAHEIRAAEIIRERMPDITIGLSSEIAPEIREYERASTTVIDSYTLEPYRNYIGGLNDAMAAHGHAPDIFIMQSNGGLIPSDSPLMRPVRVLESGPSAGVIGATWIGLQAGFDNIIAFDVGGTTAKACLIKDGRHDVVAEFKAENYYPVRSPSIDLAEIGTGGGSIAYVDSGGSLRVGPMSAGAAPGPACYGRGGTEPTVTDAAVVLGRLRPEGFMGGSIAIDRDASFQAVRDRIADPLSLSVEAAAAGIVRIAIAQAAGAVQLISTMKGVDPRSFSLVAYGGAGPMLAAEVAMEIGLQAVIVPQGAATLSAFGMLVADRVGHAAVTHMTGDPVSVAKEIDRIFEGLEQEACRQIKLHALETTIIRSADIRYQGQRWELSVPVVGDAFDAAGWTAISAAFHDLHERVYAFCDRDQPLEIVRLHVEARAPLPVRPQRNIFEEAILTPAHTVDCKSSQTHRMWDGKAFVEIAVAQRSGITPGQEHCGPLLIEDYDTTIFVPPGASLKLDGNENLIIIFGAI